MRLLLATVLSALENLLLELLVLTLANFASAAVSLLAAVVALLFLYLVLAALTFLLVPALTASIALVRLVDGIVLKLIY